MCLLDLPESYNNQDSVILVKKTFKEISGAEEKAEKCTPITIVNWALTKGQGQNNGAKTVFLTDSAGMTWISTCNKMNLDTEPYTTAQKLTQHWSQITDKIPKYKTPRR